MSGTPCHRWCAAVWLMGGLVLSPGRALASPSDSGWVRMGKSSVSESRFWGLLTTLWQEAGCLIDPSGACISQPVPVTPSSDEGCRIDPDGSCVESR
jgi:hypothetical protein